jgi:predicted nucleotidyltransferase
MLSALWLESLSSHDNAVQTTPPGTMPMIDAPTLANAVQALVIAAPHAEQILLFGSYARGDATEDSDLDFLVIEPTLENRAQEMIRLRRALRPLRIPTDVLVYSRAEVEQWGHQSGTALYWALKEGRVVHHG